MHDDMSTFHFRVPSSLRRAFDEKAASIGKPYAVLRELVDAYVDGRITIERRIGVKETQ